MDSNTSHGQPPPLTAGHVVAGRFRIDRRIAKGGFGEIFEAHDLASGARVALKCLLSGADSRDAAALARMRQEAEILSALDHPNIVEFVAVGDADWGHYFVMEFLDGRSISDLLTDEGPVAPSRAEPLVVQLLDALSTAHQTGVLHRDLKPDNILILRAESPHEERLKLVDFGIAKARDILHDDPDEGVTLVDTRAGGFVGTPRYSSPEMAVGDPASPSTDLFSLGLVLGEWLSGEPVIAARAPGRVMASLIMPEPFDLEPYPAHWRSWLGRLLEKDPDARFPSARAALDFFVAHVASRDLTLQLDTLGDAMLDADQAPTHQDMPRLPLADLSLDTTPSTDPSPATGVPNPADAKLPPTDPTWPPWIWFAGVAIVTFSLLLTALWLWG